MEPGREEYKIQYTVSGPSDEEVEAYVSLMDNKGVKANNRKLLVEGILLNRTPFKKVQPCKWQCVLTFRSRDAFQQFLDSSRPIVSTTNSYKENHHIQISMNHID